MSYAEFVASRMAADGLSGSQLLSAAAQRRGIMVDETGGLQAGSTDDDRIFFSRLRTAFESERNELAATTVVLSFQPSGDRSEAMVHAYRRKPPFFRVRYSPDRPNARLLVT